MNIVAFLMRCFHARCQQRADVRYALGIRQILKFNFPPDKTWDEKMVMEKWFQRSGVQNDLSIVSPV